MTLVHGKKVRTIGGLIALLLTISLSGTSLTAAPTYPSATCLEKIGTTVETLTGAAPLSKTETPGSVDYRFPFGHVYADINYANCNVPAKILLTWINARVPLHVSLKEEQIQSLSVSSVHRTYKIHVRDTQGRENSFSLAKRPAGISLYRFKQHFHIAIGRGGEGQEPSEIGISVDKQGPFFFEVRWPEPRPFSGGPRWPLKRNTERLRH